MHLQGFIKKSLKFFSKCREQSWNPNIFFRPIEYNIGSSDNSFFGVNLKATIFKKHILYSQLILDEFLLEEIRNNNGWWANKYGFQFGYKSFDLFEIKISTIKKRIEINFRIKCYYSYARITIPIKKLSIQNLSVMTKKQWNYQWFEGYCKIFIKHSTFMFLRK